MACTSGNQQLLRVHQVELAQASYQLPRLKRMWTHLERQAGGQSKGMGEKQKEVDKRILRSRMAALRRELDEVMLLRDLTRGAVPEVHWHALTGRVTRSPHLPAVKAAKRVNRDIGRSGHSENSSVFAGQRPQSL